VLPASRFYGVRASKMPAIKFAVGLLTGRISAHSTLSTLSESPKLTMTLYFDGHDMPVPQCAPLRAPLCESTRNDMPATEFAVGLITGCNQCSLHALHCGLRVRAHD
jgi:hypothetical protein